MISFRGIEKRFGRTEVLRRIDLDVATGRVTAIVGPNAAGKTTLMKLLLGLASPNAGDILFDGIALDGDGAYRARVGYMPQLARFPENLTGNELLQLMDSLRPDATPDDDLLARFAIDAQMAKPIRALSGGTRQKLNAAIAFRFSPDLLILDEPTAGLDPLSAGVLKSSIESQRSLGRTIIITSHVLSELDELADDVVFLGEGVVRFAGPVPDLKHRTREATLERAIAKLMAARLVA